MPLTDPKTSFVYQLHANYITKSYIIKSMACLLFQDHILKF